MRHDLELSVSPWHINKNTDHHHLVNHVSKFYTLVSHPFFCAGTLIIGGRGVNFPGQWHRQQHHISLKAPQGAPSYHSSATQTLGDICA